VGHLVVAFIAPVITRTSEWLPLVRNIAGFFIGAPSCLSPVLNRSSAKHKGSNSHGMASNGCPKFVIIDREIDDHFFSPAEYRLSAGSTPQLTLSIIFDPLFSTPFHIIDGRKGSAVVAAAIVNGLVDLAWQAYGENSNRA